MDVQSFNTQPAIPGQPIFVGKTFGIRAGAYIVDVIIMNVMVLPVSFIAGLLLGVVAYASGIDTNVGEPTFFDNLIIGIPIAIVYFVSFEGLFAATPAKLLFGMRVVKMDGSPCSFGDAVVRALYRYIDGLFFAIVAYSNMKPPLYQRLGDKSAKTMVVDRREVTAPLPEWWMGVLALLLFVTFAFVATGALLAWMLMR